VKALEVWIKQHGRGGRGPKPQPVEAPQPLLIDVEAGGLTRNARRDRLVAEQPADWRGLQRVLAAERQARRKDRR
jgi:hypothetical protein